MATVLIAVTLTSNAQPKQMPSAEERAKHETERMKTELNLTSAQNPTVEKINLKYAEKMDTVFKQSGGDFSVAEKKMNEIHSLKRAELATILTEDQLKKYDEMVAERKKNHQGPPPQQHE